MTNLDSVLKSRDITLPTKVHMVKAMVSLLVMYRYENWTIKKAEHQKIRCFRIVVLEKILKSPLDCREISQSQRKSTLTIHWKDCRWSSILWSPEAKSWLTGKDPDAGTDWRQKEKGEAENEMVRHHHQLNGPESEQTLGNSGGQRNLECCSPWGRKQLDTT